MSIFHKKSKDTDGNARIQKKWTIEFSDHSNTVRRITGFNDKAASLELERNLNRLVALRITSCGPDAETARFLESSSDKIRQKLGEWGIIDAARAASGKSLTEHVEDWRAHLEAKDDSKGYVAETTAKIIRLTKACEWRQLADISASDFDAWRLNAKNTGMSLETANMYLAALKNFCNWLKEAKRLVENPVSYLKKWNADKDRRITRRDYSLDELSRLLAVAKNGKTFHSMTGEARSLLYRTAFSTGLRWKELRSLTKASFDFDTNTVTILAGSAKNEKMKKLPVPPDISTDLKRFMALHAPSDQAFTGMWKGKGAKMLRRDMKVANIEPVDDFGRKGDFHAFRHTYGTMLAKAGVPLVMAQKLMRHSNPALTANIYTHLGMDDEVKEVAKLPTVTPALLPEREAQEPVKAVSKTGVDDVKVVAERQIGRKFGRPVGRKGTDSGAKIRTYKDEKMSENGQIFTAEGLAGNEKTPVPPGVTGDFSDGGRYWTRTSDPYNVSVVLYQLS